MDVLLSLLGLLLTLATMIWGSWYRRIRARGQLESLRTGAPEEKLMTLEELRPEARLSNVRTKLKELARTDSDERVRNSASSVVNNPGDDPSRPLVSIFPRWAVALLAIVAFVLLAGFFYLSIFQNDLLGGPIPRFGFMLSISFYLAIFFFVFYPMKIETPVPGLDTTSRLVGPIAVFFLFFSALRAWMPYGEVDRLVFAFEDGDAAIPVGQVELNNVTLNLADKPEHYLVAGSNGKSLVGLVIRFPAGDDVALKGTIIVDGREPKTVALNRQDQFFRLKSTKNKKKEEKP